MKTKNEIEEIAAQAIKEESGYAVSNDNAQIIECVGKLDFLLIVQRCEEQISAKIPEKVLNRITTFGDLKKALAEYQK